MILKRRQNSKATCLVQMRLKFSGRMEWDDKGFIVVLMCNKPHLN